MVGEVLKQPRKARTMNINESTTLESTTLESTGLESRVIAPKLRRLGNHPWAWVALGDLTEIFNQNVTSIWWHYCNDARTAALAADWDGQPWKFALPNGATHDIKNVWDMKTGNLSQVPDDSTGDILVPAGWSKTKVKAADMLEKALRQILGQVTERWTSAREVAQFVGKEVVKEMSARGRMRAQGSRHLLHAGTGPVPD